MYVPFSYDAVLTMAKAYHDILASAANAKITSAELYTRLLSKNFHLTGTTGNISFTDRGNRDTRSFDSSVFNSVLQSGGIVWENRGTLYPESGQIKCKTKSQLNCLETFKFSTVDGSKPSSSDVFCYTDEDCLGASTCQQNGYCRCETGRTGSNCQQILFSASKLFKKNTDGSERCLQNFKPPITKQLPQIRLCYNDWDSQILTTEVFHILAKEILGWPVEAFYPSTPSEVAHNNLGVLADGTCHIFLEGWHENSHYAETMKRYVLENSTKSILHFLNVGYEGKNGWYVNTQAIQKGQPVDVYAGFKKPNVLAAMNSVVQNLLMAM